MGDQEWIHEWTEDSNQKNIMSSYSLYILRCSDNSLYTGITTDLMRRIAEHNTDDKKWAKYTKIRRPIELVYSEWFWNRSEASKREYEIKQMTKSKKEELIK